MKRVADAGLTTLRERRVRGDAIKTFKTLNGFNRVDKDKWFTVTRKDARDTKYEKTFTTCG